MIFVTVGTHHDGFTRMLKAVESLGDRDLVVQYGNGEPPSNARVAEPFMPFPRMLEYFDEAEQVVTHAGVGSILLAIRHGHQPIVVPRQHKLGEHVDDHQVDLSRRLEATGRVRVVWEDGDLAETLASARPRGAHADLPTTGLHSALRDALHGR